MHAYGVRWLDTAFAMGAKLPLGVVSGAERLGATRGAHFHSVSRPLQAGAA